MTDVDTPAWLRPLYAAALAVHAGLVAVVLYVSVTSGMGGANAAPDTSLFAGLMLLPLLLGLLPSLVALLSWWMCRRADTRPSPGHMALAISMATIWLIVLIVGYWI